ncbi:MAG: hypothetical protein MK135_05415 [Polyangiaceae bacterium]|nr:hypothetical protein [Polyangiaceae bacterium]
MTDKKSHSASILSAHATEAAREELQLSQEELRELEEFGSLLKSVTDEAYELDPERAAAAWKTVQEKAPSSTVVPLDKAKKLKGKSSSSHRQRWSPLMLSVGPLLAAAAALLYFQISPRANSQKFDSPSLESVEPRKPTRLAANTERTEAKSAIAVAAEPNSPSIEEVFLQAQAAYIQQRLRQLNPTDSPSLTKSSPANAKLGQTQMSQTQMSQAKLDKHGLQRAQKSYRAFLWSQWEPSP